MKITPRPYQVAALNDIWAALQVKNNVLLQACCSFGKTIVFSCIIKRLLKENPSFRMIVMADRELLIKQAYEKLVAVAPELSQYIGFACASISSKKDTTKPITIASRQTFANLVEGIEAVQLIIFDEVHLVSLPVDDKPHDQFGKILSHLRDINPNVRFLGCTATPHRLGQGYIYGDKCRADSTPYFDKVDHQGKTKDLLNMGYLTPIRGYIAKPDQMGLDLQTIGMVAGDFNQGQLETMMLKEVHIQSVVDAYNEYCTDRKCTIIFCTSIQHCETIADLIPGAIPIHSKNKNHIGMDTKCFTSVAKLTTGVDRTDIDALIIARATMSPALHIQMIGRAARLHEGKKDSIVVDIVGNTEKFGLDLDNPVVKIPNCPGSGEAPTKICPGKFPDGSSCAMKLHASIRVCPECDQKFTAEEVEALLPELKQVQFNEPEPPVMLDVAEMVVDLHTSRASGKEMLKVTFNDGLMDSATIYLGFADHYEGFFLEKSQDLWQQLSPGYPFPDSSDEAEMVSGAFIQPSQIEYQLKDKFKNVTQLFFNEVKAQEQAVKLEMALDEIPF